MSELRIGVIGAGIMGTDHARLLHGSVSGARVVAIADVDAARTADLAAQVAAPSTFATGEELIGYADIDAVVIASHDASHAGYTLAAIERGLPVLCEKPLAPTAAECRTVIAAEKAAGKSLVSVGFMRRFDPAYRDLKQHIEARDIGETVLITAQSRGVSSAPNATSEFSVTGSAIHEFDVIPWLLDSPITEIRWFAPKSAVEGMSDPQVMLARTADGQLAVIETFLNARYGYDIRCEAVGSVGTAHLNTPATTVVTGTLESATAFPADWRPRFAEAYRLELQAWVDSLHEGRPSPLATAQDGLRATLVAEAAIQSMHAAGEPVAINA